LAIVDEAKATALRSYAVSIQTWWRGRMYRTRFLAQRRSAVKLQAAVRGYQRRKRFVELRRVTLLCQSLERMRVRRTRYLRTKRAAIVLQVRLLSLLLYYSIFIASPSLFVLRFSFFVLLSLLALTNFVVASLQKFTRRWKAKKVLKKLKAKKQRMLAIQMAKSEEERRRLEQEEQRVQAQEAEAERLELEAAERRRLHRECVDEEERQKIAALVQEEVRYLASLDTRHTPYTPRSYTLYGGPLYSVLTCD
jgi:myosin heavy subunit